MKAIEQYFPVVLFIMLYKVVLNFESIDETIKCDLSNESYLGTLFIILYKAILTLKSVYNFKCDQSNERSLSLLS